MIEHSTLEKIIDNLLRMKKSESNKIKLNRIDFCKEFIEIVLLNENNSLKEKCPFNYFYIGETFRRLLYGDYKDDFNAFYICCVRFLREYILYLERVKINPISPFITSLWDKFKNDDLSLLDELIIHQAEYIKNEMSINILNFYFGEDGFKVFKEYEKFKKEIDENNKKILENKEKLEAFISEKEESVTRLEKVLREQKTAFNFVGLSQGFQNLLTEKNYAKWGAFLVMVIISVILISLPAIFIGARFINWFSEYNIDWSEIGWEQMLPIIGLEFVLIYFFRVVLNHYNSIQTQIMQIELRKSLCQFIQSYVEYAKEIKVKDKDPLEKFENLIFSSILSTPEKVPSTFDGIDQFANFIKEIKKG